MSAYNAQSSKRSSQAKLAMKRQFANFHVSIRNICINYVAIPKKIVKFIQYLEIMPPPPPPPHFGYIWTIQNHPWPQTPPVPSALSRSRRASRLELPCPTEMPSSGWWLNQPIWKIFIKLDLPQIGVKIQNIWNHHLVIEDVRSISWGWFVLFETTT